MFFENETHVTNALMAAAITVHDGIFGYS